MQKPTKALLAQWYKKLKESGFDDAEQDEVYMKQSALWFRAKHNVRTFNEKQDFHLKLSHLLETASFKNKKEKLIWEMHANARGIREIARAVSKLYGKRHTKSDIHGRLLAIKKRFKEEGIL